MSAYMIDRVFDEIQYELMANRTLQRKGEPAPDPIEWLKAFARGVHVAAWAAEVDMQEVRDEYEAKLASAQEKLTADLLARVASLEDTVRAMHDGIGCAYRITTNNMLHDGAITDEHLLMFVDFETATTPASGQLFENYHWVAHREHGVAFITKPKSAMLIPLCAPYPVDAVNKTPPCLNGEYDPLGLEVRKIPVVYMRHAADLLSRLSMGGGPA